MGAGSPAVERIRPFLKHNTFFGGLPDDVLEALIGRGHCQTCAKGQVVCRRGEPGDSLMVVLTGRLKITNVTADGREVVLNFLAPGDLNGEIAVLDGKERAADAVAMEASEVFVVDRRHLLPALTAHPDALLEVVQILCEKLRSSSAIIEDNTLEVRSRTARGLLRLAQQHGRKGKQGIRLSLSMSQTELAGYLGLARENVNRQLARLREANVIKLEGAQIIITDAQGLADVAGTPIS
jgi:CRP-like cAMP-binding protein